MRYLLDTNVVIMLLRQSSPKVIERVRTSQKTDLGIVDLARIGKPIGPYDVLVARQAKARDVCLVTNNTCEFSRVTGLRIEDCTMSMKR